MIILSLDISTKTGWAHWDGRRVVESGLQHFKLGKGDSPGMRFLRFRKWLREMIQLIKPELIAFERPNVLRSAPANECIYGLTAVFHEEATEAKVTTLGVGTSEVKKHATGQGNCGKPLMIKAASKRWKIPLGEKEDDRADALCVLDWALDEIGVPSCLRPVIRVRRIT